MVKKRVKAKSAKVKAKKSIKRPKAKVKKAAKRSPAKKIKAKKPQGLEASLEKIGEVTHYFPHVKAAAVKLLKDGLKVGDSIYIKGHTTDIIMTVDSMQIDNANVTEAKTGDGIGIKIPDRARKGDSVFLVTA